MLQIKEDYIQIEGDRYDGKRYGAGSNGWYEPYTDNIKQLFRSCQKEHGRCTGKVYWDTPDGTPDQIGWVFEKRAKYTDVDKWYTLETWVSMRHHK